MLIDEAITSNTTTSNPMTIESSSSSTSTTTTINNTNNNDLKNTISTSSSDKDEIKSNGTGTGRDLIHNNELSYNGDSTDEKKGGESNNNNENITEEERLLALRESRYLTGRKLILVFTGMLLAVFLIALDKLKSHLFPSFIIIYLLSYFYLFIFSRCLHQTILAPALPVIASKFDALDQIAWIASAYFLTQTAFLLLYGQVLTVFDRKWTFLFAIMVFEIGSLICAAAPTVDVLIFGRAFAGVGAAGIFVSCLAIIAEVTRLEQRPKLFGLFGAVFAVSSVVGPLLGGAFTDKVSWRLCFYINLPFGAVTIAAVSLILGPTPAPPIKEDVALYTERKFSRYTFGKFLPRRESILFRLGVLDWVGSALMLLTITCLLLALQWGGNKYAWSSPTVVGTFCTFGALVILFVLFEWKFAGPSAILPLRFFKNRTQVGASLSAFFIMFVLLLATYYLPIYFQATLGVSATASGIDILPFMLGVVVASGISGGAVSYFGYYYPFLVGGPTLMCVGSGLLYTIDETTPMSKLIGYQIILSLGVGAVMQQTIIAAQTDLADQDDVPQASALVTFGQLVGGTIGIAIASTVFGVKLSEGLREFAPEANFDLVRNSVAAIKFIPEEQQAGVIHAYVKALNVVFLIGVGAGVLASLSGMLVRNLSVKGKNLMAGGPA